MIFKETMIKKLIVFSILLCSVMGLQHPAYSSYFSEKNLTVTELLCENLVNPFGIDATNPSFTWKLSSDKRNTNQTAYEIIVQKQTPGGSYKLVWKSGKISSSQSVHVPYKGEKLQSNTTYHWKVRVWDNHGSLSPWSKTSFWKMGFLNAGDWEAEWITSTVNEPEQFQPSPIFRTEFTSKKKVRSATAYITAHGMYEAHLNGERIGDAWLTPGWTSYSKRLQYQAYDVTHLMRSGANAIGVTLGSGWYRGRLAWEAKNRNIFGDKLGLLFQLMVAYSDGTSERITSNGNWKSSTGEIVYSELYDGELIDATKRKNGWTKPGFNDSDWTPVEVYHPDNAELVATYNEPVTEKERILPIKVLTTPKGETVLDFGQNLVGFVEVNISGRKGDTIVLHHAEVLDQEGNFYTRNLRTAKQEAKYVLEGGRNEKLKPRFTFYGFRYARIEGIKNEIDPKDFTAVAIYSGMKETGSFECSNGLVNKLQQNIQWGQKGNFIDVPTDCPQRDERLGWTGDAQAFASTAGFNMQVDNFFTKWLKDLAIDQLPNGSVPYVVPNVLGPNSQGSTGWGDAATIIPWDMYRIYGNQKILKTQYRSMKAWVDFMARNSRDHLWNTGNQLGDWLFYNLQFDSYGKSAVTERHFIAQCFFAHSAQIVANTARVLGHSEDAEKYSVLVERVKSAFLKEYVTPNGRLSSNTQTAYILALHFDMLPENMRSGAAKRLVENIQEYGNHITTGFLGTPYICEVLTRFGYADMAYTLLERQDYPSWLYPVTMGATTIWERWDGIMPDGSFQTPDMNSFNHYAYGAVGNWMYTTIAGINNHPDTVGYKRIVIKPLRGGKITFAKANLKTYYGLISTNWKWNNNETELKVTIPHNTSAIIYIPATNRETVMESGQNILRSSHIRVLPKQEEGFVAVEVGSGSYHFNTANLPR